MTSGSVFKVTAPLFYANAAPHVGHAHSLVLADAVARWHTVKHPGASALVLTGTDEHGNKVRAAAEAAGRGLEAHLQDAAESFRHLAGQLSVGTGRRCGLRHVRTTHEAHAALAQRVFRRLIKSRDIVMDRHAGWYCTADESFVSPRDIDFEHGCVRGAPARHVHWLEEETYSLRASRYNSLLRAWILRGDVVRPASRAAELLELLVDTPNVSVSRPRANCPWGVPVLGDASQTMYVWFDALCAYLHGRSGTEGRLDGSVHGAPSFDVYGCTSGDDVPNDTRQTVCGANDASDPLESSHASSEAASSDLKYRFETTNPHYREDPLAFASSVSVPDVHVLGKDIARFHGIMWPAMLMSAALPLPARLLIHGHWTASGAKISKSDGNAADVLPFVDSLGADSVRYYLLRRGRADADADFDPADMAHLHNAELANQAGNLFARAFAPALGVAKTAQPGVHASALLSTIVERMRDAAAAYDDGAFHAGIERMSGVLHAANAAFGELRPWAEPDNVAEAQAAAGTALASWALMMQPVAPGAAGRILDALGVSEAHRCYVPESVPHIDLAALDTRRPWGSQLFERHATA